MMQSTSRGFFLAVMLCVTVSSAHAAVLVDYELNGAQWDATDTPLDVTASVADVFGSAVPSFSINSATENWPTGGKNLADYIGFTVAADPGKILTLDQLQLVAWQGNGPTAGEMTYSFDGFSTIAGSQTFGLGSNATTAVNNPKTFNFGGAETEQVEFRIHFYNSGSPTGRLFIRGSSEDVGGTPGIFALTGSVAALPVPEPTSIMMLLGLGACLLRRKDRKSGNQIQTSTKERHHAP